MLNKKDPLIAAVQKVMQNSQEERNAVNLVNEKFGVTDRKALPHNRQAEWDAAYKTVLTEGVEALDEDYNNNLASISRFNRKQAKTPYRSKNDRRIFNKLGKEYGDAAVTGMRKKDALGEEALDEKLKGDQPKLDIASSDGSKKPDGKLTKHDFKALRTMEEENLEEAGMIPKSKIGKTILKVKARMKSKAAEKRAFDDRGMMGPGPNFTKDADEMQRMDKVAKRLEEKAPPGREDQVKALKKKVGTEKAFKFSWASYNKNKKKKK
jgi:hypothetical protein